MTTSPTPAELAALRVATAALLNSPDSAYDFASTIVFALGSAQLLQSPETAAELVALRARVAELESESVGSAVGVREAVATEIERRGAQFPADHPVAPYVRVFAELARGRDVLPRREAAPLPDPRRVEAAGRVAALVAGQRAAAEPDAGADEYRYCGATLAGRTEFPFTCYRRVAHKGPHSGEHDAPHEGPEHHDYRTARLLEDQ